MQGNGHRPKSAKVPPKEQEQPRKDAADEKERQPAPAEENENLNQQYRELKLVRESSDQKFGTDILGAVIVIGALVLCSLAAYFIWAFVLSRPAHNGPPPPMNIILPR